MTTALWVSQGLVALLVAVAGGLKLVVSREQLATKMHWAAQWPRSRIKLLGLAEVMGAIGLTVPAATGVAPWLTPVAAGCVAILMGGAISTHRKLGEPFAPAAVTALLCVFIAVGWAMRLPA